MRPFVRLPCSSLNYSRKVRTSFFKKAPEKTLRVTDSTRKSPFVVPTRKEAPTRNATMGATPLKAITNCFLLGGENLTSDALGVVSEPTIRKEVVEIPLSNDSFKASISSPVGGRLHSFRRDWQTNVHQTY